MATRCLYPCLTSLLALSTMPSKHLLKRSQGLPDTSDFDPAIMRGIDMQRHVLHIDNAQACTLDKASKDGQ
jgi:hypothetical protein